MTLRRGVHLGRDCVAVFSANGARMNVAIDYSDDGGRHFEPTKTILELPRSQSWLCPSTRAVSRSLPARSRPAAGWSGQSLGEQRRRRSLYGARSTPPPAVPGRQISQCDERWRDLRPRLQLPHPGGGLHPPTALNLDLEPHRGAPWQTVTRLDSSIFGNGGSQPSAVSFSCTRDAIATDGGDGLAITTDGGTHWTTLTVPGRYRAGS